jgi:hypothetical protein
VVLALCAVLAGSRVLADDDVHDPQLADIFERFNHKRHEGVLEDRGVNCSACHQVGARGDPRVATSVLESWLLPPPPGACHYCHNPPDGEQPTGTGACILCHETIQPPESHGAGWVDLHGAEARLQTWSCNNCHRRSFCIDCHERKEAARYREHDRAWLSVHGIAARTDPTECDTCHLQSDCVSCHSTTDGRLH